MMQIVQLQHIQSNYKKIAELSHSYSPNTLNWKRTTKKHHICDKQFDAKEPKCNRMKKKNSILFDRDKRDYWMLACLYVFTLIWLEMKNNVFVNSSMRCSSICLSMLFFPLEIELKRKTDTAIKSQKCSVLFRCKWISKRTRLPQMKHWN